MDFFFLLLRVSENFSWEIKIRHSEVDSLDRVPAILFFSNWEKGGEGRRKGW